MKRLKEIREDAVGGGGTAMSMGAGPQGLGSTTGAPIAGYDKLLGNGKMLRRKALDLLSKRRKGM
jgi:hypothetical protein